MEKFNKLSGNAIPLRITNVDTDMIIPKQFLKTIKRTGLGEFLFFELKYDQDGNEISSFALNQDQYKGANILIASKNFGCGSSREHAPWSIADYGIKCIIAPSYADIFYNNCFKNGILPIILDEETVAKLQDTAENSLNFNIDLEKQCITFIENNEQKEISFDIDPAKKNSLLEGLDDIGLTLNKSNTITDFEGIQEKRTPWLYGSKLV
ncbi:MAG: 3-isopropylmalate dehydratase small subunit [Candidatus Pelagibacterales bacterium]|jgi:3-isopropylmalate/(R)-2-methylmalate dehydratase small subunit|nr:3-isopropylmalate dehydratase small subunit [bacterium]MDC3171814.1 3-isopropylmalate dehydratase small subunit [Pelagibacteraceae bacterium]|tara:strand:- start:1399 stop:2025 length:627 start_codon:yes stop_codon:yes gene_type:complete